MIMENLFPWDYDGKYHKCFGYDIIEKTDSLTFNRLIEELFLNLIRYEHLDEKTGRIKRTYEDLCTDFILRANSSFHLTTFPHTR